MTDPYKVLNVSPDATDEEIKKAYRELARKYHPDNYHDSPLEDMASEKMKEINEAYDTITKMRKGGGSRQNSGGSAYGGSAYGYGGSSSNPLYQQVRMAINRNDISTAESLLQSAPDRGAEWNFLMGAVCYRKGWLDEARKYYESACQMDPDNEEYRRALDYMAGGGTAYRPQGFGMGGLQNCDPCLALICLNVVCGACFGGRVCIC